MGKKIVRVGRKMAGPTGSWRRRWGGLLSLVIIVSAALLFVRTVRAVHDTGSFQLDGDAATDTFTVPTTPVPATDDWDKVCYQVAIRPVAQGGLGLTPAQATAKCGIGSPTSGAIAASWVEEPNPASSIFTGGGSKDPHDISDWLWKNDQNNPPDKDNLVHAYAVRYSLPNSPSCPSGDPTKNCDVIYFGSDRFDNSGDATQGFWFLQNKVELTNTKSQGGFLFSGVHRAGDLLVISDFSNGGTTSTITVYTWDPTCLADNNPDDNCDDGNLRLLANLTGAEAHCLTSGPADQGCGLVNPITITMPWLFVDKSATPANGALNGEFFEAGINLSLLGLSGECFATVVSETRASTSTDATLKDFVVGSFANCASNLVTTPLPSTEVFSGASVQDSALLTITGATTWSGTLSFFLCSPSELTPPNTGTCTTGGTLISSGPVNQSTPQPILSATTTVTALGKYCWRGFFDSATDGVPDATDASETECFTVVQLQPAISTVQTFTVKDSATITVTGGGNLVGSVRFRLYNNPTCDPGAGNVNLLHDSGAIAVSGASPQTKETAVITLTTPNGIPQTLSWLVEYTSTNLAHAGVISTCNTERASLTVVNHP
jgi:hypothetical protein